MDTYRRLKVPVNIEKRMGITAEQYRTHQEAGEKWCTGCKAWVMEKLFNSDTSMPDGLQRKCRSCDKIYRLSRGLDRDGSLSTVLQG